MRSAESVVRGRCGTGSVRPASSVLMTGQSALTATSRRGALRLVVLALAFLGFAALHAFGSVAGAGTHCGSAPALMMVADSHNTDWSSLPDHHAATSATHDESAPAAANFRKLRESGNIVESPIE